ncbi:MAG: dual specificity protein phosphatase family protein [Rubrobacteraceae bacterium]
MLLRLTDRGTWIADGVLGCAYPRTGRALAALSRRGIRVLINLHERPHDPRRLANHNLREAHLPVEDFAAPTTAQIERGLAEILNARSAGAAVAVHCGGGLGRTGTLLACYLVSTEGNGAREAVERIRRIRPGSVETKAQVSAVELWARNLRGAR